MLTIIALDTYHWWGPIGYLFRNTPGNIIAGFIQLGIGLAIGAGLKWTGVLDRLRQWWHKDEREAEKWTAQLLADMHLTTTGRHAAPHPEHGQLTSGPKPGSQGDVGK